MQRELPFRLLADVAYVGNLVKDQQFNLPINDVDPVQIITPRPDQIDPTTGNALPTNFLRPYIGRAGINERVWIDGQYQRYDALQVSVQRRLSQGFAFQARTRVPSGSSGRAAAAMTGTAHPRTTGAATRAQPAAGRTTSPSATTG